MFREGRMSSWREGGVCTNVNTEVEGLRFMKGQIT